MESKLTWTGGMSFTGKADSGFETNLGASPEVGGADDGFRPLELFLMGLAGCTAMDVISILKKKRQDVTGFNIRATTERANDHPRIFTGVDLYFEVYGHNVDPKAVERAIELSETKYCSASAMLRMSTPIRTHFEVHEAD